MFEAESPVGFLIGVFRLGIFGCLFTTLMCLSLAMNMKDRKWRVQTLVQMLSEKRAECVAESQTADAPKLATFTRSASIRITDEMDPPSTEAREAWDSLDMPLRKLLSELDLCQYSKKFRDNDMCMFDDLACFRDDLVFLESILEKHLKIANSTHRMKIIRLLVKRCRRPRRDAIESDDEDKIIRDFAEEAESDALPLPLAPQGAAKVLRGANSTHQENLRAPHIGSGRVVPAG